MPLTYFTRALTLAVLLLIVSGMHAQFNYQQLQNIPFSKDGKSYATPWLGGFNNPVITSGDLDNDGMDDLAILEKGEGKVYTFKNGGTPGKVDYSYAPELAMGFPDDLSTFITLRDFNCDGIPDLYTYSPIGGAGIGAFIGRYENNILHFDLYINRLYDNNGHQIYLDPTKLPAFDDLNGDGDIDILLFEQSEGTMGYYENQQVERGDCDTLEFVKKTNCFGQFCECAIGGELAKFTFDGPNPLMAETLNLVKASAVATSPVISDNGVLFNSDCNSLAWHTAAFTNDTSYQPTRYIEFMVGSDSADFTLFINNITFKIANADACDPVKLELRSSADGYSKAIDSRKTLAPGCNTVKFHLLNDPFFYKADSVKFRLYAFQGGICSPGDINLIVDRIGVEGQINRKGSFDIILDYYSPFCNFNYFTGGGGTQYETGPDTVPGTRHVGSTVAIIDFNRDGWKDVLIGDAGFGNLIFLINSESSEGIDSMVALDYFFPTYDESVLMPIFPAAYYLDVNNDNKKDLLVAPFQINNCFLGSLQDTVLNKQNLWYYRNVGVNQDSFEFVTSEFLVGEMVDFGDRPHAAFFDYNRDGLQDLVIGQCHGYGVGRQLQQGLILYENTGTQGVPSYEWVTDDFAHLHQYNWYGLRPAFGDLNDDDYFDMVIGTGSGEIRFFQNAGIAAYPDSFIYQAGFSVPIATSSLAPQLVDINGDGLLDLVVGEYQGRTFYYRNDGTELAPDFVLVDNFFGKMDARLGGFYGYSVPFFGDIDRDSHLEVLVGNYTGKMIYYDEVELTPPGGPFRLVDTNLFNLNFGRSVTIHGADITNDGKLEFVVATGRGGLAFFGEEPIGMENRPHGNELFEAFPNPAQTVVHVRWKGVDAAPSASWQVLDLTGRLVNKPHTVAGNETIAWKCADVPRGMYFVRVKWDEGEISLPVILQ